MTAARDLVGQPGNQVLNGHRAQVFTASRAHGHCIRFEFPVADDQHIGDPLQCVLADFKADLFISQVQFKLKALFSKALLHFFGVFGLIIVNANFAGL